MNKNIKEFITKTPPAAKRKKEMIKEKYGKEIFELRTEGYSLNQIKDYILSEYKIKTSRQMISTIYNEIIEG
ncbi:hypothetical protein [Halarcobacter bivalviorum]|uniref:hypothetical protein n=1 Tax=Halarcobacter bivalviorum TaxID=663364 RepID=UPI00100BFB60|nr:hypothetical protein [Halarcobacter bivalviorum]RXK06981.1 hypothetical protein CRU97_02415 [Halarcobacter bivalviorum]